MKKTFLLLVLALSTTAQTCDFLDGSIGNNYPISKVKRHKQNLADIITNRNLEIIKKNNKSLRPSMYKNEIENSLKKRYPTLNTDHINIFVIDLSYIEGIFSDFYVQISSTSSGNYTGVINLTCMFKQEEQEAKRQKQNLADIITSSNLEIIKADNESTRPSTYKNEIRNSLKRKYPALNTDHIEIFVSDLRYIEGISSDFYVQISSTSSGNYTGVINLTCMFKQEEQEEQEAKKQKQKQKLSDIITSKNIKITNNESARPSAYAIEIKNFLKRKFPALNMDDIEVKVEPTSNSCGIVRIYGTSSSNYRGEVQINYTIEQLYKQNLQDTIREEDKDLGIIKLGNGYSIPLLDQIKDKLKRKFPALDLNDIEVKRFFNDNGTINSRLAWIYATSSGKYTGKALVGYDPWTSAAFSR
ncbi:hypothetical protein ACRRVB_04710 [Candidatus Cardinium hertigii]|uniref:hypothetical protein n=1 Tax=Candidatus Cardinium hertigii TaxID=247481 RepID=UPI003D7DCCBD